LRTWQLPFAGYNGDDRRAVETRRKIVEVLSSSIGVGQWRDDLLASADAVDAVLCAFAAIAVTENRLAVSVPSQDDGEGWIAVHE